MYVCIWFAFLPFFFFSSFRLSIFQCFFYTLVRHSIHAHLHFNSIRFAIRATNIHHHYHHHERVNYYPSISICFRNLALTTCYLFLLLCFDLFFFPFFSTLHPLSVFVSTRRDLVNGFRICRKWHSSKQENNFRFVLSSMLSARSN